MWIDQHGSEIVPEPECLRLLALAAKEDGVGRLAVSRPDAPVVLPVNFAYTDRQVLVRLGEGFMADKADGSLVAFEVDRLDQPDSVAWSVLVRGLATILSDDERQRLEDIGPRPLIPAPGQIILAIRTDVVTGRRFPVGDAAPSPSSMGPVATRAVSSPTPSRTATKPGV